MPVRQFIRNEDLQKIVDDLKERQERALANRNAETPGPDREYWDGYADALKGSLYTIYEKWKGLQ